MPPITPDERELKDLLKATIVELLEERKDLLEDVLEEALLDIGLARAIEAGEHTVPVHRDQVLAALEVEL